MNSVIVCAPAKPIAQSMMRRAIVFLCIVAAAMCIPARAQAQADLPAAPQQDAQAQRSDLAAEVEELRREIDEIKEQLVRITAVQRLQTERLLQQSQPTATTTQPAEPQPQRETPRPATPAPGPAFAVSKENGTPTIFVFKDGNRTEAHNFAIVGGTLWVYTDEEAKKYAVSYIDVPATTAANAARGNKFQMPESK